MPLSLFAVSVALAAAAPPQIPFEKYQLPNGLTVILSEDHRVPVVATDLWYHVGAANEVKGRSGFAHLFEHLMFQGSKHLHGDERTVFAMLERNGATNLNGTTEWDRTNYFQTMPADRLELTLWLESDRMGFLLDTVDQQKLDTQRGVVRNEKRQSIENVPYGRAGERLAELLFPQPHPYFGYVIGSHEDLQAASLEDVKAFFHTYYAPDNASLAIVGDFDPKTAKALVEKYFGPIPRGPGVPPITARTEPITKEKRETMTDAVQLTKVIMGFIGPRQMEEPAMQIALRILGAGKACRLYHDLVYEKKIAQEVTATNDPAQLGGEIDIEVTAQAGHAPEEIEAALTAELKRLRDTEPSPEEVARAKRSIEANVYAALENPGGFGGKADLLDLFEMWKHDPGFLTQRMQDLAAVTPADVKATANKYLNDNQRVVLTVLPEQKAASAGGEK